MIAAVFLFVLGAYLAYGLCFAIPFALIGVKKIDSHAAHGSWGFRVLIIPGTMFLWPLLARRWVLGIHEPPEENNPHRCAARNQGGTRGEETQPFARTSSWFTAVLSCLFGLLRASGRSADFQSAVSPNSIRQRVGLAPRVGFLRRPAECNSAIQQSTTLRYGATLSTHVTGAERGKEGRT